MDPVHRLETFVLSLFPVLNLQSPRVNQPGRVPRLDFHDKGLKVSYGLRGTGEQVALLSSRRIYGKFRDDMESFPLRGADTCPSYLSAPSRSVMPK